MELNEVLEPYSRETLGLPSSGLLNPGIRNLWLFAVCLHEDSLL